MIVALIFLALGGVSFLLFRSWVSVALSLQTLGIGVALWVWITTQNPEVAGLAYLGMILQWVVGVAVAGRGFSGWDRG